MQMYLSDLLLHPSSQESRSSIKRETRAPQLCIFLQYTLLPFIANFGTLEMLLYFV